MSFDKALNISTFDPTFITIQAAPGRDSVGYTLTGAFSLPQTDTDIVLLELTPEDRNGILSLDGLAVSRSTTYLSMSSFVVVGLNLLYNEAISPDNSLLAAHYGEDFDPPNLLDFNIDLNSGTITFYFDETVDILSFNVTEITLQEHLANTEFKSQT